MSINIDAPNNIEFRKSETDLVRGFVTQAWLIKPLTIDD